MAVPHLHQSGPIFIASLDCHVLLGRLHLYHLGCSHCWNQHLVGCKIRCLPFLFIVPSIYNFFDTKIGAYKPTSPLHACSSYIMYLLLVFYASHVTSDKVTCRTFTPSLKSNLRIPICGRDIISSHLPPFVSLRPRVVLRVRDMSFDLFLCRYSRFDSMMCTTQRTSKAVPSCWVEQLPARSLSM